MDLPLSVSLLSLGVLELQTWDTMPSFVYVLGNPSSSPHTDAVSAFATEPSTQSRRGPLVPEKKKKKPPRSSVFTNVEQGG